MFNLLVSYHFSNYADILIYLVICAVIVEVVMLACASPFGRFTQKLFNKVFGPRTQILIGGLGASIHEGVQLLVALVTGHNLHYSHFIVGQAYKQDQDLTNIDHYWSSPNVIQETSDFFLGIIPFYVLSTIVLFWQKIFAGNPFTTEMKSMPLSNYLNVGNIVGVLKTDFFSAFSGIGVMSLIPFTIGIILLTSSGLNFSVNECAYTARGMVFWAVVQIGIALLLFVSGTIGFATTFLTILFNYSLFIMMRAIFYSLVVMILLFIVDGINKVVAR